MIPASLDCHLASGRSVSMPAGAVLLAAGEARRMGGRPKCLLELGGVALIRRNLAALSGAGVEEIVVVLGHRADEIEPALRDFPVTILRNVDYALGQMVSLHVGLAALSERLHAFIVAMADQPLLDAQDVTDLIGAYKRRGPASAVVPYVDGERGNPIILDAAVREAVLAGDAGFGCRQWLAANPERVLRLEGNNRHYCVDIDSPEDIERFEAEYGHRLSWPPDIAA
jgi:molybdenum cofactor cytidylyltransferase